MKVKETLKTVETSAHSMAKYMIAYAIKDYARWGRAESDYYKGCAVAYKSMELMAQGLDIVKANEAASAWVDEEMRPAKEAHSATAGDA